MSIKQIKNTIIYLIMLFFAGMILFTLSSLAEEPVLPTSEAEESIQEQDREIESATVGTDMFLASDAEKPAELQSSDKNDPLKRLFDGDLNSRVRFDASNPLTITIPEDAAGLRFLWFSTPVGANVTWLNALGRIISSIEIHDLYETMLPVPDTAASVLLSASEESAISEIVPIDPYEVENYLYFSDPLTNGPIDAMVFCAHAGDEFISFGSLLPTMCDDNKTVLTVFMSHLNRAQLQEALDCAREMRQPYEPIFMNLTCVYLQADRYSRAKKIWDLSQTERTLLTMIRQYKPTVVISHKPADENEEGMRRFTANLILQAVTEAAIPRKQGNITKLYGAHTVSKLLLAGEPAPVKKGKYDKSTPTPAPLPDVIVKSDLQLLILNEDTNGVLTETLFSKYKTLNLYQFQPLDTLRLWISYCSAEVDRETDGIFGGIIQSKLSNNKLTYAAKKEPESTPEPILTPEPTTIPTSTPEPEYVPTETPAPKPEVLSEEDGRPIEEINVSRTALYLIAGFGVLISLVLFLLVSKQRKVWKIIFGLFPALISVLLAFWLSTRRINVDAFDVKGCADPAIDMIEEDDSETNEQNASIENQIEEEMPEPDGITPISDEASSVDEEDREACVDGSDAEDDEQIDPNDVYFRQNDEAPEIVVFDDENGHWEYRSDTLSVLINKFNIPEKPLVYYVAHIRMREVDQFRPGFGNENLQGSAKTAPWKLARRARAVLAITGDNLVNTEEWLKGILIRNGQLYSERTHEPTMALMPDMSLKIYEIGTTAAEILDEGVQNTYGFGPVLIRDGVIAEEECSLHRVKSDNPRCGLGMVEPGHYVAIVCDGRQKGYSMGTTLLEFAEMFRDEGCVVAYNMDGGISSGMLFMGESIHQHHSSQSKKSSGQRPWADALLFGYSELVPTDSDPIYNTGNLDEKKERPKDLTTD